MSVEPTAPPQIGGDSAGTQGGNGAADEIKPELVTAEHIRQLRDENATRRWNEKKLKEERDALKLQNELLAKQVPNVKPGAPATQDDAASIRLSEALAKLDESKQRIEALESKDKEREAHAQRKLLRANLTKILTEAKVINVDEAIVFLEARGARITEDEHAILDITNESGETQTVVLRGETLRKFNILTPHWFPPQGVGGAGSAAPRGAPAGVDLERAKTDPKYLAEHEKEVFEHLRAQGAR